MRLGALPLLLLVAAGCASLVGVPDVPDPVDGGGGARPYDSGASDSGSADSGAGTADGGSTDGGGD